LLTQAWLNNINQYQAYTDVLGDDIVALGMPTQNGGAHVISTGYAFAISASSPHRDAAWDFIRRFLQPDLSIGQLWSFPLRMDVFDRMVDEAKIPHEILDVDSDEFKHILRTGVFRTVSSVQTTAKQKLHGVP